MKTPTLITLAILAVEASSPAQVRAPLLGEVRAVAHAAVAGADVHFYGARRPGPACLDDCPTAFPPAPPVRARSDHAGRFRILVSNPPRGALLITRSAASKAIDGALVCHPRSPVVVVCRPIAEIQLGGTVDVHVQAIDARGEAIYLGVRHGTASLRLPGGHYRLLLIAGENVREHEVRLRAGTRIEIEKPRTEANRTVKRHRGIGVTIRLRHWPNVPLPERDGRLVALPCGDVPARLLIVTKRAGCESVREAWMTGSGALPRKAAPAIRSVTVTDVRNRPVPGARVLSVHRIADALVQLDSSALTDEAGHAGYDVPGDDDNELIVIAPGFANAAVAVPDAGVESVVLRKGHHLTLKVFDPRGEPAANVGVEITPENIPLLRTRFTTDGTGVLALQNQPAGMVTSRLRSPRMLARTHRLLIIPGRANHKTIRGIPGFLLRGRVLQPGGAPAPRAIVTLRDTTGQVDVSRTTRAAADGSFRFLGLPEDLRLRLSARWTGPTGAFISRRMWAQPDASVRYEITLRSEDPTFPGRRRDG